MADLDARLSELGMSCTFHSHDGFTLYASDDDGYLVHRRFIDYSIDEAIEIMRAELTSR
jgi:hypothetical protein